MDSLRALPRAVRFPLFVYRLLFPVVFFGLLPGALVRMLRRGNYREKFGERFGLYSREALDRLEPGGWIWIHAVSVGEMMMALQLARTLEARTPGARILISTTTSTGFAIAREKLPRSMELIYYPLDMAAVVRRVLEYVRPTRLVLVDKELWPNMVSECFRRGVPVSIVNARLSPRSERGFLRWRRLVQPFFSMLDCVCVQEREDVERWGALGVRREALHYTGSLKFDFALPSATRATEFRALLTCLGVNRETPVLLGGSTFPGEEAILCRILLKLRARFPDLFLIVAPRHVERTPEVLSTVRALGLRPALRTQAAETAGTERPDVLIVNTTGELRDWYSTATVCFVGKSLCAIGGQNPAEPVLAGRPVVFGPHMENFGALVSQFLAARGAVQVPDENGLAETVELLLGEPAHRERLAANACAVLEAHRGANDRTAKLLADQEADASSGPLGSSPHRGKNAL